ncbi:hypothetical protein NTE_01210 [Candidatus Nitrososphaera evergladensis SR1]|uniref:Uncharacterized protein n=1 Tax=Candidatus Nitrososphaera evergladensis SR1 TaxID=1459636 RepID=A0A075MR40_9ARCH|nr:hypothetical protein [Candidatus Nitrososphaera evergladensis]AIF83282.1 hypothetical protein NTE_01210 [Candidatus Nitrososphaera evergladensis SR1]
MSSLSNLGSNDVVQLALGAVGGFAINQIANSQPVLNSPIIPLGNVVVSKADALTGGLGLAAAGTGYVLKQKTFVNLGAGAVVGTIISRMASGMGFNLQSHVNSAIAHARRLYDNTFPSGAYGINSAPVQNQNGLRKMSQVDLNAMNNGRMNSYMYGQPLKSELTRPNSAITAAMFSYT